MSHDQITRYDLEQRQNFVGGHGLMAPSPDGDYVRYDDLQKLLAGLKPEHECEHIARATRMAPGRDWWIGRLTKPIPGWEHEKYCLHLKTPLKDVVFLLDDGDLGQLAVLLACAQGSPISERWVKMNMQEAMEAVRST